MVTFLFSAYFGSHFVTMATVKIKSIPDFYTWAIVLINYSEKKFEEQYSFFGLIGGGVWEGQNSLLMHVPL